VSVLSTYLKTTFCVSVEHLSKNHFQCLRQARLTTTFCVSVEHISKNHFQCLRTTFCVSVEHISKNHFQCPSIHPKILLQLPKRQKISLSCLFPSFKGNWQEFPCKYLITVVIKKYYENLNNLLNTLNIWEFPLSHYF
jgi:hypothetical protein